MRTHLKANIGLSASTINLEIVSDDRVARKSSSFPANTGHESLPSICSAPLIEWRGEKPRRRVRQ